MASTAPDGGVSTNSYHPAYRANDHTYAVIIDMSMFGVIGSDVLRFGVSDGVFADNDGGYRVTVRQLDAAAVPEPATLTLLGTAIAGLGARRFRARRQQQSSASTSPSASRRQDAGFR